MGRAERRRQARANRLQNQFEALQNMKQNELAVRLAQNGITQEDVDRAEREGIAIGFQKTLAGMILAARKEFHFGQERLMRLAVSAYNEVMVAYDTPELLNKAIKDAGIEIDVGDPLDPITIKKTKRRKKTDASKTAELSD